MFVCNHTIAEVYAVLTKYPSSPRISVNNARRLIQANITKIAKLVNLTSKDYNIVISHLTENDYIGGVIYDALIYQAAIKSHSDKLITLNKKDFDRLNIDKKLDIVTPF